MGDDNQFVVPASFVALFVPPRAQKPTASREAIAARYELCEDLALTLAEHPALRVEDEVDRSDAVARIRDGLLADPDVVSAAEAGWVVQRLGELLRHGVP